MDIYGLIYKNEIKNKNNLLVFFGLKQASLYEVRHGLQKKHGRMELKAKAVKTENYISFMYKWQSNFECSLSMLILKLTFFYYDNKCGISADRSNTEHRKH